MALEKRAIGLDLGEDAIKAVELRVRGSEAEIVRQLVIRRADLPEDEALDEAPADLAARIARELSAAGFRSRSVVLSVNGEESILRYNHAPPMPPARLALILKYEVDSVAERMGEPLASDHCVLPTLRDDGEQTVLLGLAKETALAEQLDALTRAGLSVEAAVPSPIALHAAWDLFGEKADMDSPDDDLVVLADVGRKSLDLALVLNNRLIFARGATFGGETFTAALSRELHLSRDQAEKLKVAKGGVDESHRQVDHRVVPPLRSAAGQLLSLIESTLRLGQSQAGTRLPKVTRLWITGGGARLRGLPEYIAGALGKIPFEVFEPVAAGAEGDLAVALGLSALGIRGTARRADGGDGAVSLSILPSRYLARRIFRERTRWLWASASALGVLLVVLLVGAIIRNSKASASLDALTARHRGLLAQAAERDTWRAEAESTRARIDRLLREADPTPFQAFLLDFFARSLRPEIQLESLDFDVEEVAARADAAGDPPRAEYVVIVRGRIDNRTGHAGDWQLELLESLESSELVRRVANVPRSSSRDYQEFELVVFPNPVSS